MFKKFSDSIEAADVFAFVLLLGVLILNYKGIQLMLPQAILVIVGYYFGRKLTKS